MVRNEAHPQLTIAANKKAFRILYQDKKYNNKHPKNVICTVKDVFYVLVTSARAVCYWSL